LEGLFICHVISVLIPAYNEDPTDLCQGLLKEGRSLEGFEVLVGDDCSLEKIPIPDPDIDPFIRVIRNSKNLGYNKNRNNLAREAKNKKLLFLDADVRLISNLFLENYIKSSTEHPDAFICGGMVSGDKPMDSSLLLKWHHMKDREGFPAEKRSSNPGRSFSAANFLCPKSLFLKYPFSVGGLLYGYNDTIYGLKLESTGEQIIHTNNPVINTGLITAEEFIDRAKQAAKNLTEISEDPELKKLLVKIRLFKAQENLKKFKLRSPVSMALKLLRPVFLKNLMLGKPNLKYYDYYRLSLLLEATG
jgi:glycosyltransferase involved in cell wall biosynthesis